MKHSIIALFLFATQSCISQTKLPVFKIFFDNSFDNDSTTVILNGVTVAKNLKLKNTMISPKSLIITQSTKKLTVQPYYGSTIVLPRLILENNILRINLSINNVWTQFKFDLKKGKYFFVERLWLFDKQKYSQLPTIRQSSRGPMYL
jgi:hypothetical protein